MSRVIGFVGIVACWSFVIFCGWKASCQKRVNELNRKRQRALDTQNNIGRRIVKAIARVYPESRFRIESNETCEHGFIAIVKKAVDGKRLAGIEVDLSYPKGRQIGLCLAKWNQPIPPFWVVDDDTTLHPIGDQDVRVVIQKLVKFLENI